MKTLKNTSSKNKWLNKPVLAGMYQSWLTDNGSLTAELQKKYTHFSVKPMNVNYQKAYFDEARLLNMSVRKTALIREVCLIGNKQPVVFAHSVLPRQSLRGCWARLGRLGNKPLGAALFSDPKVKRTPLSYKKLSRQHQLYRQAINYCDQSTACLPPEFLWARRSVFSLNCASILVTEIFLPRILK